MNETIAEKYSKERQMMLKADKPRDGHGSMTTGDSTPALPRKSYAEKRADDLLDGIRHKLQFAVTQGLLTAESFDNLDNDLHALRGCVDDVLRPTEGVVGG